MLNGAACVRVQIAMKKRQAIFFVSSLHVGMDRIPFKKPSHLERSLRDYWKQW